MSWRKPKIGLIVLAAGSSSRMNGRAKQLLVFRGKTLLRRAVETALAIQPNKIAVVFSESGQRFKSEIEDLPVELVINSNAASGISSSIKTGLAALAGDDLDAILITLCDQPLITSDILENVVLQHVQTGKPIIACKYENTFGVPALFAREFFAELMNLSADEGAKKLVRKYRNQTEFVEVPEAASDVDTFEDYRKLTE